MAIAAIPVIAEAAPELAGAVGGAEAAGGAAEAGGGGGMPKMPGLFNDRRPGKGGGGGTGPEGPLAAVKSAQGA